MTDQLFSKHLNNNDNCSTETAIYAYIHVYEMYAMEECGWLGIRLLTIVRLCRIEF